MKFELSYRDGSKTLHIPDQAVVTQLQPLAVPVIDAPAEALNRALAHPLACRPLTQCLRAASPASIAIAVDAEPGPAPLELILATLMDQIRNALSGLDPAAVIVVIGAGLHPPGTRSQLQTVMDLQHTVGFTVLLHDANHARMRTFGTTSRGTPVAVNAALGDADFKMVIGQIEPHQFAGFTGGYKEAVIGCAAPSCINHNYSLMLDENARVGRITGNPVREDIDEAGCMIGIDFAVNAVMNRKGEVVSMLAGSPPAVLAQGARICADLYGVVSRERFDIVVASCGAAPGDSCLYQAQKGLNLASHAVKQGGKILLLAACQHGIGDDIYFDYVCQFATPRAVLNDFKNLEFKMGPHKAYLFGRTLVDFDVAAFSDLDPAIMRRCHLRAADPSTIVREWVEGFSTPPRVAVIPYADTTYFHAPRGK